MADIEYYERFRLCGILTDQVSVLEIEAIELIACLLGVVHVLVDHKCGTFRVVGNALPYLPVEGETDVLTDGQST